MATSPQQWQSTDDQPPKAEWQSTDDRGPTAATPIKPPEAQPPAVEASQPQTIGHFLHDAVIDTARGLVDTAKRVVKGPQDTKDAMAEALMGPLGPLVKDAIHSHVTTASKAAGLAKDAWDALKRGEYGRADELLNQSVGHFGAAGLPVVGPLAANLGEKAGGTEPQYDKYGNVLVSGKAPDPTGAAGDVAALATGPKIAQIATKIGDVTKTIGTEVLGATTGSGGEAVRTALTRPSPDLIQQMRAPDEMGMVSDFRNAVQNVKDQRGAAYRQALQQLPQNVTTNIVPVRQALMDALDRHRITVTPSGLDFSRSAIGDVAAQNVVKAITEDVSGWGSKPGDLAPAGMDILKRRIDDYYAPSSNSRAFVQAMKTAVRDELNRVPGYQEMTKGYATASDFLDKLQEFSLDSKNPGTAIRKLTYALKQNNNYRQTLTEALDQYSPKDLKGQLAGYSLSKVAPRGLMGPASGAGLLYAIVTGSINPSAAVAAALASPRVVGELMTAMSKLRPAMGSARLAAPIIPATGQVAGAIESPSMPDQETATDIAKIKASLLQ